MTRMPTLAAIRAVELELARTKRGVRESLGRLGKSGREALARPSTLVAIAAAACVIGILLARRLRTPVRSAPGAVGVPSPSLLGIIAAFALQYGLRNLPAIVRRLCM